MRLTGLGPGLASAVGWGRPLQPRVMEQTSLRKSGAPHSKICLGKVLF